MRQRPLGVFRFNGLQPDNQLVAAIIEQPAAAIDVHINQGATLHFTLSWTVDGVPQPLRDLTARASFAPRAGATPWFTLAEGTGLTLEPGAAIGVIDVVISHADSQLITRNGSWDLVLYDSTDTQVRRLAEGAVVTDKAVTVVPA